MKNLEAKLILIRQRVLALENLRDVLAENDSFTIEALLGFLRLLKYQEKVVNELRYWYMEENDDCLTIMFTDMNKALLSELGGICETLCADGSILNKDRAELLCRSFVAVFAVNAENDAISHNLVWKMLRLILAFPEIFDEEIIHGMIGSFNGALAINLFQALAAFANNESYPKEKAEKLFLMFGICLLEDKQE